MAQVSLSQEKAGKMADSMQISTWSVFGRLSGFTGGIKKW